MSLSILLMFCVIVTWCPCATSPIVSPNSVSMSQRGWIRELTVSEIAPNWKGQFTVGSDQWVRSFSVNRRQSNRLKSQTTPGRKRCFMDKKGTTSPEGTMVPTKNRCYFPLVIQCLAGVVSDKQQMVRKSRPESWKDGKAPWCQQKTHGFSVGDIVPN